MNDEKLVEVARSYLGVKWKHQGRSRAGVDCVGLVIIALHDCGIPINARANYGRTPYFVEAKKELIKFAYRESFMSAGTIVVYKMTTVHIAIATGPTTIIQAVNTVGRVTESAINFVPSQFWRIKWPS